MYYFILFYFIFSYNYFLKQLLKNNWKYFFLGRITQKGRLGKIITRNGGIF